MVTLQLERKTGRLQVHLHPGETGLPLPPNITLNLRHRGLNLRVMPPFPVGADRCELYGEETLLVGETYTLSASAGEAVHEGTTEFTVQGEPTKVDMTLERASTEATLTFRAQPPSSVGHHASGHWTASSSCPRA